MGNMEGLVTLLFFKIKSSNLASSMYFSRPCNFAIFEGISSEFGKMGYFDMLIKFSVFHKYSFIC